MASWVGLFTSMLMVHSVCSWKSNVLSSQQKAEELLKFNISRLHSTQWCKIYVCKQVPSVFSCIKWKEISCYKLALHKVLSTKTLFFFQHPTEMCSFDIVSISDLWQIKRSVSSVQDLRTHSSILDASSNTMNKIDFWSAIPLPCWRDHEFIS